MRNSCPDHERIAKYLEGKLSDADRERLEAHAAECDDCAEGLAAGGGDAAPAQPSEALEARILATFPGRRIQSRRRRGVRTSRRRRPVLARGWIGLAAAAAVALVAVLLFQDRTQRRIAEESGVESEQAPLAYVEVPEGAPEYARAGTERWSPATEGQELFPGDRLRTGSDRARVRFGSGSVLHVNRSTALSFGEEGGPPGLSLHRGEIYVETVPADRGFFVETPHGRAVDLGTRFGVETEIEKGTTVVVAEGRVVASTEAGRAEVGTRQEVLLARLTSPPGPVREASDLEGRFAWAVPRTEVRPEVAETYSPVADTYVDKLDPSRNYGTAGQIRINGKGAPSGERISYFMFNIPGRGSVKKALLKLHVSNSGNGGAILTSSNNRWSETSVTYESRLPIDGPEVARFGRVSAGSEIVLDVTQAVRRPGLLTLVISTDARDGCAFSSKEAAGGGPALEVSYARVGTGNR